MLVNIAIRNRHWGSWSDQKSLIIPEMLILRSLVELKMSRTKLLIEWYRTQCWNPAIKADVTQHILEQRILVSYILLCSQGSFLNLEEEEYYIEKAWSNLTKLFLRTYRDSGLSRSHPPSTLQDSQFINIKITPKKW